MNFCPSQYFVCVLVLSLTALTSVVDAGTQRALIVVGLPGNEEFHERFIESTTLIHNALVNRFGFEKEDVRILFGQAEGAVEIETFPVSGRSTLEEIAEASKALSAEVTADDQAWVFVIGHSYWDGRTSHFNIPDRDITHEQLSKSFANLGGEQSVFFICAPASGPYIKALSKPNRIVITATEVAGETNASHYHSAVAKTMMEIGEGPEFDLDKDGVVSVLDLYVKSTQTLADMYLDNEPALIATEHPLLDDNGDGSGSELQIDYLTKRQGGRSDSKRKRRLRKFKDGAIAAKVPLPLVAQLNELEEQKEMKEAAQPKKEPAAKAIAEEEPEA